MTTLAIDIGGTRFRLALFQDQNLLLRHSSATDRDAGPAWMLDRIRQVASSWLATHRVDACGIGFGGPVDFYHQRVALSTHVGGWQDFDFPAWVHSELGLPAVVDNDANVGALGEATYGAGKGFSPLFYMTVSTGIGGGIVFDGQVWRGADSYAGEIGHVPILPDGPQCLCGARGCLERLASGLWLERDFGRPAEQLFLDPDFVSRYVVNLALGIKTVIMLLNPARIVIGGGISRAGENLFAPLRAELRRQITSWSRARIDVVAAALGDDSVIWGALALARAHFADSREAAS